MKELAWAILLIAAGAGMLTNGFNRSMEELRLERGVIYD